jgi:Tfp pilus assembly protein PilN
MASPLEYLKLGKTGLTDEQLTAAAAVMAAPVGLAMAPLASPATRLNTLVPAEDAKAGPERRARVLTGVAVGALAAVLAGAYGVRTAQVSSARDDAEQATERSNELDRQVQVLIPFEQAEAQINAMRTAAQAALATDVDIPVFMDRMTAQMPQDVGLTSFTLSIGAGGAAPAPGAAAAAAPLGTVTVSATGLSHDSTAHWITRMRELGILSDLWVPSSTKGGGGTGGGAESVTFSSNMNITQQAKSARADLFKASEL